MNDHPGIEWRDEFTTGIASVDQEHKMLVEMVNNVIRLMDHDEDHEAVIDALGDVNAKVSAHFALEELLMRKASYAAFEPHKEDHENLLDEIRDIMDAFEAGDYSQRRSEFVSHLTTWFVTHFSTMDAKLHHAGIGN
ncbi:MAG: hemerythrin family protein [Rhodospirillales bacterium]|nr:hemerythrin family protein [Rhodospirillales bacterium]